MSVLFSIFGPSQTLSNGGGWLSTRLGLPTWAGTTVTPQSALGQTAVYSAIGIISDVAAQLPIDIFQKDGEKRVPLDAPVLSDLLNVRPNTFMSAITFRNTIQAHVLGWGNGYAEIERNGAGEPVGLWPLLPDRTCPVMKSGKLKYQTQIDGTTFILDPDNVLHISGMGFDGLKGYSPLELAREAIGLGFALEEHGGKFFANESRSGGFVQHPGRLGDTGTKNLRDSVNDQGGLDQAHRIKVLEEGAKFIATTIAPEDAQFLQTRGYQVEEVARLYRVPLFMLQSHSKDTSWGSGLTQMSVGFVTYTMNPWLIRWEQEMDYKLLSEEQRAAGAYIKHNPTALLRGDPAARSTYYTAALSPTTGWMGRNEVRALEDLNPEDPEETEPQTQIAPPLDMPEDGEEEPGPGMENTP